MTFSNRTKPSERDQTLHRVLLGLNTVSGYTTIVGAMQIFPGLAGLLGGGTIQMLLFLLTSNRIASHAPKRKWFAALAFSSVSIYTSFFAYYDMLTEKNQGKVDFDRATRAHAQLVSDVFTPIQHRLAELDTQTSSLRERRKRELQGADETGLVGDGPVAQSLASQANVLEDEAAKLRPLVSTLKSKFNYSLQGKQPEEILQADREALSAVPQEKLPEKYKSKRELDRQDYIDEETTVKLVAPYYKVMRSEVPAVASLLTALTIDGLIVVLGTAIEVRRRRAPFEEPAMFCSSAINGIKSAWSTIEREVEKPALPFDTPREDDTIGLQDSVNVVTLKLKGKGSDFLTEFYQSIDQFTGIVNTVRLQRNTNETFAIGYRMLLDALHNPRLNWLAVNPDTRDLQAHREGYSHLTIWLREEIYRQCEAEREDDGEFYSAPRDVRFKIPRG